MAKNLHHDENFNFELDEDPEKQKHDGVWQILTVIAFVSNFFLWSSVLPTSAWIVGACMLNSGLLYLAMPFDLIPDHWRFGLVDDAIAAIVAGVGIKFMVDANAAAPAPAWVQTAVHGALTYNEVNIYNAVLFFGLITIVFSPTIRYTLVAFNAIAAIPSACFHNCAALWALGFTCIGWGVVGSLIPIKHGLKLPLMSLMLGLAMVGLAGFANIPMFDTSVTGGASVELIMVAIRR
jgi:uncharacterized membrane protein YkvA (DUF1232 family)